MRNVEVRFWRSVCSQRSSGSSQTGTSSRRPHAGDRGADVDPPERRARLGEEPVDLELVGQVGLQHRRAAERGGDLARPLLAAVVVDGDARALGRERARAGGADAARRAGDEHALA